MFRDHFAVSDSKLTRSEQLRVKEEAFLATRSRKIEEVTSALRVNSDGEDEKCSMDDLKLSMQPYSSMSLRDASDGFSKLIKGISLDEDIGDENFDEEEGNLAGLLPLER